MVFHYGGFFPSGEWFGIIMVESKLCKKICLQNFHEKSRFHHESQIPSVWLFILMINSSQNFILHGSQDVPPLESPWSFSTLAVSSCNVVMAFICLIKRNHLQRLLWGKKSLKYSHGLYKIIQNIWQGLERHLWLMLLQWKFFCKNHQLW